MDCSVNILPLNQTIRVSAGSNLLTALRETGCMLDAPCGGYGTCGKCTVIVNGQRQLACQTTVDADMTICFYEATDSNIVSEDFVRDAYVDLPEKIFLAIDIGTTTVVCYLIDGADGKELSCASMLNPQVVYGADVISRIQSGITGKAGHMRQLL